MSPRLYTPTTGNQERDQGPKIFPKALQTLACDTGKHPQAMEEDFKQVLQFEGT
jgi:hypothetical protein